MGPGLLRAGTAVVVGPAVGVGRRQAIVSDRSDRPTTSRLTRCRTLALVRSRTMWDRLVGGFARLLSATWFSHVEVEGLDRFPAAPVAVAANHANGFVDPVLLRGHLPRPARFLAKATLWRIPLLGRLLSAIGALPVQRSQDSATVDNVSTFAAAHEVLRDDGLIALFPEGDVHGDMRLHRVHTGTARIVLGARDSGVRGIQILPVGLVYQDQARARRRALVRIGEPLDVDRFVAEWQAGGKGSGGEDDRPAVDELTRRLTGGLRAAAVDYADRDEALTLANAVAIHARATGNGQVTLGVLEPRLRQLAAADEERRRAVLDALATYRLRLALLGADDQALDRETAPGRAHAFGQIAVVVVLGPVAVPGALVNLPAYLAVDQLGAKPMARASRANFELLASLVAFPLGWLALGLGLRRLGLRRPWVWTAATGPVGGFAALAVGERVQRLRRSRTTWRALIRDPEQLTPLVAQRAQVIAAVETALGSTPT
jgi:glycerol-3-phosphate O-acyltransferase / dihydroxyacetone phosphate acyltransferase